MLILNWPWPFVSLWKSSGSGRRRRHDGLPQPLQLRLELPHLGLKVNETQMMPY